MIKKVIGYIRVSTDHQDLERQKNLIRKFCESRGYTLMKLIEDFGISGAESDRKGYLELQALSVDACDMIVVSELARLSRDEDVMKTLNTIYALMAKFDLVMLDDLKNIYTKGASFDLMTFISLAFKAYGAADERKKIAERMKTGKYSLISKYPLACLDSTEPLGFKKVANPEYTEKCKFVPQSIYHLDENEVPIVQNVFKWASEGLSTHKITDRLNSLGIKSQWGKQIGHSYIVYMLKQPLYKGVRVYKGIEYPTGLEIVSPEIWNQVQLILKENRTRADKYIKHCNPLKGILKCPCGCNMQIVQSGNTRHYACVARANKKEMRKYKGDCPYFGINVEALNDILWYEVKYRILDEAYKAKSNDKIDSLKAEIFQFEEGIKKHKDEIAEQKKIQSRIIDNLAITENSTVVKTLEKKVKEIDDEIKRIKDIIEATEKEIAKNQRKIKDEMKSQSIKELQEMTLEGKGEIFKDMFEKVEWVCEKQRRGFIIITYKNGIEVIWLYKNVKGTKVAINLPSFQYNRESRKVVVKLMKSSNKPFDFSFDEIIQEYTPDEILKSFDFVGNEEYDASNIVWK